MHVFDHAQWSFKHPRCMLHTAAHRLQEGVVEPQLQPCWSEKHSPRTHPGETWDDAAMLPTPLLVQRRCIRRERPAGTSKTYHCLMGRPRSLPTMDLGLFQIRLNCLSFLTRRFFAACSLQCSWSHDQGTFSLEQRRRLINLQVTSRSPWGSRCRLACWGWNLEDWGEWGGGLGKYGTETWRRRLCWCTWPVCWICVCDLFAYILLACCYLFSWSAGFSVSACWNAPATLSSIRTGCIRSSPTKQMIKRNRWLFSTSKTNIVSLKPSSRSSECIMSMSSSPLVVADTSSSMTKVTFALRGVYVILARYVPCDDNLI